MQTYIAKNGKQQYRPSIAEVMLAAEENAGFCLACGETQDCVEPDAERYVCESCGEAKVYGAEQLVILGIVC
jgi:hypothetical protein